MNPFAIAALFAVNKLLSPASRLSLKSLQLWIDENSDRDRYGMGYGGNRLPRGPGNGFVEVTKAGRPGKWEVRASVFLDPQQGAAISKSWHVSQLDSQLEKYFGKDQRVRVKI